MANRRAFVITTFVDIVKPQIFSMPPVGTCVKTVFFGTKSAFADPLLVNVVNPQFFSEVPKPTNIKTIYFVTRRSKKGTKPYGIKGMSDNG